MELIDEITKLHSDCIDRYNQLKENASSYRDGQYWESAIICDIKAEQFELFINRLKLII